MQKAVLYGIIAAIAVAGSVGIAFAAMSMNGADSTLSPLLQQQQQQSSADSDVRIISHAMGETEITGTPERVVVLYSVYVGDVRALGVMPVGVADRDFQNSWLTPLGLQLSEDVASLGIPNEPNFEAILQLEPDLIIGFAGVWSKQTEMYEELNDIAPTLLFDPAPPDTELDELGVAEQNFMAIADALNRHDEGVAWLESVEEHYDEAANKIEQAGYKDAKVILATVYLQDDVPEMFIFTEGAFATLLLNKLGLVNEVPDPADTTDTWYRTGMEGLATLDGPDVHLIVSYDAGQHDTIPLERSPLWDTLEFVKNGHVHDIGSTRLFNQVLFAEDIANRVVAAMAGGSETRIIGHQMGETEVTGIPKRVVVLEWTYAEHVLALGVEPVGVADIETMNEWVNLKDHSLSASATDVGLRWEPNLEVIAQLEPDLIIGDADNNGAIYADLSSIAPTLLFNAYPLEGENVGGFERMKEEFMTIADVLGRHDQGIAVLERMDQKIAEGREIVEASGATGEPFALLMAGTWEGSTWLRIYTENGQASEIIEMMGMENAWPVQYGQWGYSDAGLEDLTTIQDATLFYIALEEDNPFETTYEGNPVWENLAAVGEGRVYPIGGDTWTYGGPISAELIVEKVAAAIEK